MPKKCVPEDELQAAAAELTQTWFVLRGERQYKVVKARSAGRAMKMVKGSTGARPSLPTREWDRLYQELGPPCLARRR